MKLYTIVDEYGVKNYSFLNDLFDLAIKKLDVQGIFSVIFIDDEKIKELNTQYRNINRSTDVLSFALNDCKDTFDEKINVLGDIYISIPTMKRQAEEYEHSEKRELGFLAIHGLLHLLGYNHIEKEEEKIMFSLQKEILDEANIKE